MNHKIFKYMGLFLIMGLLVCTYAKENGNRSLSKVEAEPSIYKFNVNNISTFIYADGRADVDGGVSGFEFPKGSNRFAVYQSGFNWGGRLNGGEIRFGGTVFPSGLVTGKIGTDPDASRMYRVRPDWTIGSMLSEINDNEKSGDEAAIRDQYRLDWMEWPVADGAPYLDADGDGIYNPDPDGNGVYDIGEDIPGVPGAHQTIYFIANASDGDKARQFYGSPPQLIEMRVTIWGYASVGPLGNMMFKKYNMLNLGTDDYTDFYVGIWCDPDVGNAGDDFVGCDTLLSLGYAYNASATDSQYGDTPPASGHDFFQGPIVEATAADTALISGEKIPGFKNLGMTAFYYFINEEGIYGDPDLDNYSTGTLYFYNLMQGKIGASGEYFPIPEEIGGGVTRYPLSGDPITGEGYVDGIVNAAKDRRYGMSSGPFTLAAGSHQEIVIAQIAAMGSDNLASVRLLKSYDVVAQDAYNGNFVLPSAPTPPFATYSEYDQAILLRWDSNPEIVEATESHNLKGYAFQGYNVYQLPEASSTFQNAIKIATFDIVDGVKVIVDAAVDAATGAAISVIAQKGNDTGIQRYLMIDVDAVNNNIALFNGTKYYFAITAYAYSDDEFAVPKTLENTFATMTITPQGFAPGVRAESEYGDELEIAHVGPSDGSVAVSVIDPANVTGEEYNVVFSELTETDAEGHETVTPVWHLDNAAGTRVLENQTNQTGDANYLVADGIQVKVIGPPLGIKQVSELDAAGEELDANVGVYPPSLGTTGYIVSHREWAQGAAGRDYDRFDWWGMDDLIIDFSEQSLSWDYLSEEVHIDVATGLPNYVPYSMYRVKFPSGEKIRLFAGFWDTSADGVWSNNGVDDWTDYGKPSYEPIYAWQGYDADGNEISYDPANEATYITSSWLGEADVANTTWGASTGPINLPYVTATLFVMYTDDATIPAGNQVYFKTNKPNTAADTFTFTAPGVGFDNDLAKEDIAEEVNVFPNPYYGANPQELNKYQRFVTFNHLPDNATIRIFNLAGQLVKTFEKTSTDQFQRWDLTNTYNLPVASGVYVAYIDMPDVGTTKVLKLAIIQEQQVLDRF